MQNGKKIVVLAMYCNKPLFLKQEQFIRDVSYAKDIMVGKYENVDFYSYTASKDDKYHFNKNSHRIYVPCDDSLEGTFDKTKKTLMMLNSIGVEYDYVFRTNCSTFVNISLLEKFVNGIPEEKSKVIYGSMIYCSDGCGPERYDFYVPGNSLLIPKFWCDVICDTEIEYYKKFDRTPEREDGLHKAYHYIDDNTIGFICNVYAEQHNICKYDIWGNYNGVPQIDKNIIDSDFMDHIVIPIRIYNGNREYEFVVHRTIVDIFTESSLLKLSNREVFDFLTKEPTYLVFDFGNRALAIHSYELIRSFVDNKEIYNYSCRNFISKFLKQKQKKYV